MASFIKRGKTWQVEISYKGKRFTGTFSTKTEAKEWANRKEVALKSYASGEFGKRKTVCDAFKKYKYEVSPTKNAGIAVGYTRELLYEVAGR